MRILLVEDYAELAGEIACRIERAGFAVDRVGSIESASAALDNGAYTVTLLDRRLPDGDGLSLISQIRKRQPTSRILVLTALDSVDDKIEGLDAGADDYLTKPFNLDEMMARVRASLRRRGGDRTPPIIVGALSYDLDARTVSIANRPVLFLRRELALLDALLRRANCVVPRERLLTGVYGFDAEVNEHALTALVSRVRARLAELDSGVEIHAARGLGYLIAKSKSRPPK
ncbi:response regulator transcription factor [Methylosinus sp. H3A]|uniref:response regulator transcription factor n=1 Tax=Methylosinus sp. H3A TaxID=2785786 RepID=UPI0018C2A2C1|nr:response regulator transcription factor [Methylosinus sp. H3A]MBG0812520.1 response regulator transcription factor [Methylosinus sp. H3A]